MKATTFSLEETKKKLEYYCAYQDRCHAEVEAKLHALKVHGLQAAEVISHLVTNNFLNEERFAKSFARGKHRIKGWGKSRIVQELKMRNITSYNINAALSEINEGYLETFDVMAEKIWINLTETNLLKKKKKFCDKLLRRGFEVDLVYSKMSELAGK